MTQTAAVRSFDSLTVGETAELNHVVTAIDIERFSEVSGDHNPLHTDSDYAASTDFKTRIVHGMFLGALVSRFVGMILPGKYSVLLTETMTFRQPVRAGETLLITGTISQKSEATRVVVIDLAFTVAGNPVANGSVHVRLLA